MLAISIVVILLWGQLLQYFKYHTIFFKHLLALKNWILQNILSETQSFSRIVSNQYHNVSSISHECKLFQKH